MNTEAPMAQRSDACPDPEQLAAYIDGGLPPDERTLLEEHLADCPDCRDILGGSVESLDEIREELERQKEQALVEGPSRPAPVPKSPVVLRPTRPKWIIPAAVGLIAAAAIVLAVRLPRPSPYYVPEMAELVRVETPTRATEARLSGFSYGLPPIVTRGAGDPGSNLLAATAQKVRADIADRSGSGADAARGVTFLLTGDVDHAIESLERAATSGAATPEMLNDLAAASLQRGRPEDLSRALTATERALQLRPSLRAAAFNRALALERLQRTPEAEQAWRDYAAADPQDPWAREATDRLNRLTPRPPR